jgi:hypothetical protein
VPTSQLPAVVAGRTNSTGLAASSAKQSGGVSSVGVRRRPVLVAASVQLRGRQRPDFHVRCQEVASLVEGRASENQNETVVRNEYVAVEEGLGLRESFVQVRRDPGREMHQGEALHSGPSRHLTRLPRG